jgi:hypothetical protein
MYKSKNFITVIKNLPYNIKNIFQWSKILWNNFDWDDGYLMNIIEYKLSKMKKYFENGDFIEEEEYDKMLEKINVALNACHQLTSRDFELELLDPYYKKYPFHIDTWTDENGRVVHGMKSMEGKEKDDFLAMTKTIDEKELEYNHQLFDTMRDYHDWWWD